MEQNVIQIGNSIGVLIPSELKEKLGFKKGTKVRLEIATDQKSLVISKAGIGTRPSSLTPEFLRVVERVNKRYKSALQELAKR